MRELKTHLTIDEQLRLLESRGLEITDRARAARHLRRIGYYRLSAYCWPFLISDADGKRFVRGTAFRHVAALYVFDKKFRLLVLDALERIEIAGRAASVYLLGQRHPLAHRHLDLLNAAVACKHDLWLKKLNACERRFRKSSDCRAADGDELPIWASCEMWSFGTLASFYELMKDADRRAIAARFGGIDEHLLDSWLSSLRFVRNAAAHHGRLWNRALIWRPRLPKKAPPDFDPPMLEDKNVNRIYAALCILVFMLRYVCPSSQWPRRMRGFLLNDFPDAPGRNLCEMGFPPDWEDSDFWTREVSPLN